MCIICEYRRKYTVVYRTSLKRESFICVRACVTRRTLLTINCNIFITSGTRSMTEKIGRYPENFRGRNNMDLFVSVSV